MDAIVSKTISRDRCISCGSPHLNELSGGRYGDEPLRSLIEGDPWGENPIAFLADERWSLVQCGECAQKFHRFILSPHWNEIRFNNWMSEDAIREFEAKLEGAPNHAVAHVQHILRFQKIGASRLLDFGCGFGDFLEMCGLFGLDAVGVDRSTQRRQGAAIEIVPELADVEGQFDVITMFEVLEHLDDPRSILSALRERLSANGILVIEVPDTSGVTAIRTRDDYYKVHPLDHINAFTPETLVGMLDHSGFKAIPKPPAFVTTSFARLAKDVAKAALKQNRSTQRYFTLAD